MNKKFSDREFKKKDSKNFQSSKSQNQGEDRKFDKPKKSNYAKNSDSKSNTNSEGQKKPFRAFSKDKPSFKPKKTGQFNRESNFDKPKKFNGNSNQTGNQAGKSDFKKRSFNRQENNSNTQNNQTNNQKGSFKSKKTNFNNWNTEQIPKDDFGLNAKKSNNFRRGKRSFNKEYKEPEDLPFAQRNVNNFNAKPKKTFQDNRPKKRPDYEQVKPAKPFNKFKNDKAKKPFKPTENKENEGKIRLNRFIANAGVCSRREADELIEAGEISVNGKIITELGYHVNPTDEVIYKGKKLKPEKFVYVLLNKPKDYITTTDDPEERKTVMDLVKNVGNERIYPVGRLDRDTTGLLLLTNDGDLAQKLSHPSFQVTKIYQVELDKAIKPTDFQQLLDGIELEDGVAVADDAVVLNPEKTLLGVEIHLGRNRIIRRIFEALGYEVVKLDRTMYGGLNKKDLPRGHWRYLTPQEVIKLKHLA
jgi:23S rRNA pseudouridine2605 synthase